MSLLKPLKGTVVHFNPERKFGFIRPDIARSDRKELHFHLSGGCMPDEDFAGQIDLMLGTRVDREPRNGDRVVYYEHLKPKGPQAFQWTYLTTWEAAEKQISIRPNPYQKLIRISLPKGDELWNKHVAWEGFIGMLYRKFEDGELACIDHPDAFIEERTIYRWDERSHPMNSVLAESKSGVSDQDYFRMERFYFAYLIEEGIRLGEESPQGKKFATHVIRYAAIGRKGEVEGFNNIWDIEDKMPSHRYQTCAAVHVLTGLRMSLLAWATHAVHPGNDKASAQRIANYLRTDNSCALSDHEVHEIEKYKMRLHLPQPGTVNV